MMLERWQQADIPPVILRFWNGVYVKMLDRRTQDGGIVSLALNITDTIRREEDLREARDKARAADRAAPDIRPPDSPSGSDGVVAQAVVKSRAQTSAGGAANIRTIEISP